MIRWIGGGRVRPDAFWALALVTVCACTAGCDGEDTTAGTGGTGAATVTSNGGQGGSGASGGAGGNATGGAATGGSGGTATGGAGGTGGGEALCTDERAAALGPIDEVSEGEVTVLDQAAGEVFIDASAGGVMAQKDNPWVYVSLSTMSRVDVTDVSADASDAWDLAIKRPVLRVNGGDGGLAGKGGALHLDKEFEAVTAADAQGVIYLEEGWFDGACTLATDEAGAIKTTFAGWYLYENMTLTPAPGTWLVRGADGASIFKLQIVSYYSNPDGSPGMAGGRYLVRVAPLAP